MDAHRPPCDGDVHQLPRSRQPRGRAAGHEPRSPPRAVRARRRVVRVLLDVRRHADPDGMGRRSLQHQTGVRRRVRVVVAVGGGDGAGARSRRSRDVPRAPRHRRIGLPAGRHESRQPSLSRRRERVAGRRVRPWSQTGTRDRDGHRRVAAREVRVAQPVLSDGPRGPHLADPVVVALPGARRGTAGGRTDRLAGAPRRSRARRDVDRVLLLGFLLVLRHHVAAELPL